jgi:hypothetical protein
MTYLLLLALGFIDRHLVKSYVKKALKGFLRWTKNLSRSGTRFLTMWKFTRSPSRF